MRQQVRKLLTARLQTGSAMTAFMTAFTCFRLWTHRSPPLTGGLDRIRQQPTPTAEGHNSDGVFGSARIRKLMMLVAAILARAIMIAGFCALGGGAFASPVQYGLNFYEFTSASGITWSNAEAAAEGLSYNGVNGHLATVTSAGENIFLASLISSPPTRSPEPGSEGRLDTPFQRERLAGGLWGQRQTLLLRSRIGTLVKALQLPTLACFT